MEAEPAPSTSLLDTRSEGDVINNGSPDNFEAPYFLQHFPAKENAPPAAAAT
jgi:hypothetical protein